MASRPTTLLLSKHWRKAESLRDKKPIHGKFTTNPSDIDDGGTAKFEAIEKTLIGPETAQARAWIRSTGRPRRY